VEQLKVLLRLAHDVKAFAKASSFEHAVTLAVEIAKQNEGWLKSQHQGRGQNRRVILDEIAEPRNSSRCTSTVSLRSTGLPRCLNAALGGFGLAYVPEELAQPHIIKRRLRRVLEDWCAPFAG
jgi:DNA-binding transcriptional LysR family regulator